VRGVRHVPQAGVEKGTRDEADIVRDVLGNAVRLSGTLTRLERKEADGERDALLVPASP
jgi:hypothetical protein